MTITCPGCGSAIQENDINVATDIALCRRCGRTFSFAEASGASRSLSPDLNAPPAGAWFERTADGFRVGATTRSWFAIFLVPFTCVWAGGSVGSIYGKQILSGHFNPTETLVGLPFLLGSIAMIAACAMMIGGKVEIRLRGDILAVFTGVGSIGWTRSYNWSDFDSVREDASSVGRNWNGQRVGIVLEGRRRLVFGTILTMGRRYFVASALRQMLRSTGRTQGSGMAVARFGAATR
jgi:hypothetical protein